MADLPAPHNCLMHQVKSSAIGQLKRPIDDFTRGPGQKNALHLPKNRCKTPLMVDYKELRVKIALDAHSAYKRCAEYLGYTTVSEFVRVAIAEKMRRDCYHLLVEVEEVEEKTKKG